jgi:hypothetical protein
MEGIEISYGDSGYFRSLFLALSQGKEKLGGAARRPYGVGPRSLGMLDEFSDRVLTIKQFRSSSL